MLRLSALGRPEALLLRGMLRVSNTSASHDSYLISIRYYLVIIFVIINTLVILILVRDAALRIPVKHLSGRSKTPVSTLLLLLLLVVVVVVVVVVSSFILLFVLLLLLVVVVICMFIVVIIIIISSSSSISTITIITITITITIIAIIMITGGVPPQGDAARAARGPPALHRRPSLQYIMPPVVLNCTVL